MNLPLILVLAALSLQGCSMTTTRDLARATAQAEANKSGCLCIARKCSTVISASGQAALEAEATQMSRSTVREITLQNQ
jgi:hypothetical protein